LPKLEAVGAPRPLPLKPRSPEPRRADRPALLATPSQPASRQRSKAVVPVPSFRRRLAPLSFLALLSCLALPTAAAGRAPSALFPVTVLPSSPFLSLPLTITLAPLTEAEEPYAVTVRQGKG
jgi:hypothetical protein